MSGKIRKAIVGNILTGALGRLIAALGPILVAPLMIRDWGLATYGEWLILTAIPAYVMIAPDFGLAGAVVNRMPFLVASGREGEAISLYRASFVALALAAGAFVALGWAVAFAIDWSWLGVRSLAHSTAASIIGWYCIYIFVAQQAFLISGIYRSVRRNPRFGLLLTIDATLVLSAGIAVLAAGYGPVEYVVAITLTKTAFLAVLAVDSRFVAHRFTPRLSGVSFAQIRPYVMPGAGHAGMPLVYALQNQGVLLVLGGLLGPASVGIFQTARVLSNGIKSIYGVVASAVNVELPALMGEGRYGTIEHLIVRNLQVGVTMALVGIAGALVAGPSLYALWLHGRVAYDAPLVLMLMLSLLPALAGQPFLSVIMARNEIHRVILVLMAMALVSLAVTAIGASVGGTAGAAVGTIVWEAALALAAWNRVPKSYRPEMNAMLALKR